MEFFKSKKVYDFMGVRKFWIPLSILLTVVSAVLLFYPGPNYGTDFRGGTEIEVEFKKPVDASQIRHAVTASGQFSEPDVVQVQREPGISQFLIRVQEVSSVDDATKHAINQALCLNVEAPDDDPKCPKEARATEVKFSAGGDKIAARYDSEPNLDRIKEQIAGVANVKLRESPENPQVVNKRDHRVEIQLQSKGDQLMEVLQKALGADVVPERALRVEWVGPKAGKQLRQSAMNAVALSILLIMVYLAFRFDLRFSPGVVLACLHDALVVLGVFVVLRKEVTLTTIAAILTLVGYSINDTVVVYDRIRENLHKHRGKSFPEIINMSVSETLSRTILTSVSTLISIAAFFYWGTGVIRDFALAMFIGIIVGTYSSIYVAAPLTEWIDRRLTRGKGKSTTALKKRLSARAA